MENIMLLYVSNEVCRAFRLLVSNVVAFVQYKTRHHIELESLFFFYFRCSEILLLGITLVGVRAG